jgi:hypothetical protein
VKVEPSKVLLPNFSGSLDVGKSDSSQLDDPKTAMLRDLKEAVQTLQHDNVMIIIGGDFNESTKNLG